MLTGSKYVWLYAGPNVPGLLQRPLKTARAWAIKETLRDFWRYRRVGWARLFWKRWYCWATHSRLASVIKVAKMLTSAQRSQLLHAPHHERRQRGTQLQDPDDQEDGLWLPQHGKTAIYFHCGGLQLYPAIPSVAPATH